MESGSSNTVPEIVSSWANGLQRYPDGAYKGCPSRISKAYLRQGLGWTVSTGTARREATPLPRFYSGAPGCGAPVVRLARLDRAGTEGPVHELQALSRKFPAA